MVTNIYGSNLSAQELIIKMLNKKYNFDFKLNDFIWLSQSKSDDGKTDIYKLKFKNQEIFVDEFDIHLTFLNNAFVITPTLIITDDTLNPSDCIFGYTEDIEVYRCNRELRLNYLAKSRIEKPNENRIVPTIYTIPILIRNGD